MGKPQFSCRADVVENIEILHKAENIFSKGVLKTIFCLCTWLLKLWEYCLGKHHSNKTEKTRRQANRAIYAAKYTREEMEEMKVLNIYKLNIYQVLTFLFKTKVK